MGNSQSSVWRSIDKPFHDEFSEPSDEQVRTTRQFEPPSTIKKLLYPQPQIKGNLHFTKTHLKLTDFFQVPSVSLCIVLFSNRKSFCVKLNFDLGFEAKQVEALRPKDVWMDLSVESFQTNFNDLIGMSSIHYSFSLSSICSDLN